MRAPKARMCGCVGASEVGSGAALEAHVLALSSLQVSWEPVHGYVSAQVEVYSLILNLGFHPEAVSHLCGWKEVGGEEAERDPS